MEAAQQFLDKLNSKRRLADTINLTLQDVYDIWKDKDYPKLTDKGKETYDLAWSKFKSVKDIKMRDINTATIQPLVDAAIAKGRSRSTQEKIRSMYSLLCQRAMELDIIDRNYAQFLSLFAQEEVRRDVFTIDEINLVLADAAINETSKIIAIFLYTGFRLQELLDMPMSGVNMERWIFIGGEKTEAGKNRVVPILSIIRPFVEYFYARATGDLFLSGYVGNINGRNFRKRDYYPTLERLGIRTEQRRMNPHSCRYTLATRGHSLGIDNDTLSKILGHADFDVTSDIYIQADIDKLHQEMSKLDPHED
ncbi:tyrosine-type recombinase/integrase [Oscillibacter sp.]|uniref:tyrosine-type recombinase/integrase n=1 Tax=Oscillibacter sp. TaxID=1945593 RepID=UPI0033958C63